jgi:hypothetical protein
MQPESLHSKASSVSLVARLLACCWLITKLISCKLWLTNRLFPLVPIHDRLVAPGFIHLVLFAASVIALVILCFRPRIKTAATVLLITELGSCLLDQNRWQPWEYQFIFMLLPLVLLADENRIQTCWQIILVGLYFFSGLSKLNQKFIMQGWNGMIVRDWLGYTIEHTWMYRLGYLMPLIEMGAALALLFSKSRKTGVVLLCVMHGFILLMFGPAGLNINIVLWHWNILMPFLVFILFYRNLVNYAVLKQKQALAWLTLFCWWVIPWLNLFGYMDDFFAGKLFSGKTQYLFICTANPHTKRIFAPYYASSSTSAVCDSSISVFKWGIQEMNVPPNPEMRIFKKIIQQWEQKYDSTASDTFMILNPKYTEEKWSLVNSRDLIR